jgi:ammonia channel protein AmtB
MSTSPGPGSYTPHIVDGHATGVTGLFYGGTGAGQLLAQIAGMVTIVVVMGGLSYAFFRGSKLLFGGIRSDEESELAGLDLPEMGVPAYPDFVGTHEADVSVERTPSASETVSN